MRLWIYLLFRYKTFQQIQVYGLTKLHSVTPIGFNMTFLSTANFTQFYTYRIQTLIFWIQFQHYRLNNFNHGYKNYNFRYNDFYYGYKFLYWLQFTINLTIFHFHMSDTTMKNQLLSSCFLSVHFKHHCCRYNINDYRCSVLISTARVTSITDGNTAMYNTITRQGWCNILSQP